MKPSGCIQWLFILCACILFATTCDAQNRVTTLGEIVPAPPKYSRYIYDSLDVLQVKLNKEYRYDVPPDPFPRLYLLAADTATSVPLEMYIYVRAKYTPVTIDNTAASYTGSPWIKATGASKYMSTFSYSDNPLSICTYSFVGSGIQVISENFPSHGKIGITIDEGAEIVIDCFSMIAQFQKIIYSKILPEGMHTIKIRPTGTKNPLSQGANNVVDGFIVRKLTSSL